MKVTPAVFILSFILQNDFWILILELTDNIVAAFLNQGLTLYYYAAYLIFCIEDLTLTYTLADRRKKYLCK